MIVRTVLLVLAGLLLIAAVSSALSPRETRSGHGASALAAAANNPDPPQRSGAVKPKTVSIPPAKTIHASVGQVVNITAKSETQDLVDIPTLGYDATVGPGLPAQLTVIAPEAGDYPIILSYANKRIATLKVAEPGQGQDQAQSVSGAGGVAD